MKRRKTNILIFSHEASFSGAPIFLINLIQSFHLTGDYNFFFIFKDSGPLLNEFKKLGPVYVETHLNNTKNKSLKFFIRFLPIYKIRKLVLRTRVYFFTPKLLISNTIVNSKILSLVNKRNKKLVTIVHEMKDVIELFDMLNINNSSELLSKSDILIAVSSSVKNDLINHFNVQENKIETIKNTISYFKKLNTSKSDITNWKKDNNIPNDVFLVGSCGGPIWRKGPDIFLNICKTFVKSYPKEKIYFIWQGGEKNSAAFLNFKSELLKLDLDDYVRIIPTTKNIHFFYSAIDIFISTAREEPFGLSILEAGLYELPCIAFEKSGGPEELLSGNKGLIVSYGNYHNAAKEIYNLKKNQKLRNQYSKELNKYSIRSSNENNFLKYKKIVELYSR